MNQRKEKKKSYKNRKDAAKERKIGKQKNENNNITMLYVCEMWIVNGERIVDWNHEGSKFSVCFSCSIEFVFFPVHIGSYPFLVALENCKMIFFFDAKTINVKRLWLFAYEYYEVGGTTGMLRFFVYI